jgi:beta-lactamase class A
VTPISSPFTTALTAYAAERTDTITAAVEDLGTGQTFYFNPGVVQDEASVVKVDIMATLLAQQPDGTIPTEPSEQSLLTSMIDESDNDSATALWDQVGGPAAIASFNRRAGMMSTTLSACVTCANFPWPGWGLTTTSALDQIVLLRQFVLPDSVLSASQRGYALGLMENVESSESWGVSGGVPPGVTVALKNGWLPLAGVTDWQVNSVGWIDGDGRDYLVAVLTGGNPSEQYGIDTINDFSQSLWSQLG